MIERLYVYMFIFHDIKYNFLLLKVKGAPQKWLSFLKFILESECAVVSLESKLRASWQKTSTSRGSTSSGGAEDRCSGGYLFKRLQLLKNYPISPITIGARRVSKIRKFCILELRRFLHFYIFSTLQFFQLFNIFSNTGFQPEPSSDNQFLQYFQNSSVIFTNCDQIQSRSGLQKYLKAVLPTLVCR